MGSKIKKFPLILAFVLILTGSCGYIFYSSSQEVPTKILLANSGGNVVFTHAAHLDDYSLECRKCHHKSAKESTADQITACSRCHPGSFDQNWLDKHQNSFKLTGQSCTACHHSELADSTLFDHDSHLEYTQEDCQSCHHTEDIEPEPQSCSNCHSSKGKASAISMQTAAHTRCADCHQDMFDDKMKGCSSCHEFKNMANYKGTYSSCSKCHDEKPALLIPETMGAFHGQCIGCHKENQAGPFLETDCYKCHLR